MRRIVLTLVVLCAGCQGMQVEMKVEPGEWVSHKPHKVKP